MSDCDNYDYEDDEEYSYVDEDDDDSGTDDEDDFEQIIHELKENDVISLPTSGVATSTVVLPSVELLVASTKHTGNQHFRATVQELEGVDARTLVDSYAGRFVVPVASNTGDDASSSGWTRVSDREALSFVQSVINNIRTEEEAEASVPTEQDTTMLPPTEIETTNRFVSSNNEEEGTTPPSTEAHTLLDGNGAVGGGGESMHDWDNESLATTMTEDYNFVPTTQHYGDTNHDITDDAGSWDVVSQISEFDLSSIASFQTAGMATTASSYVMPGGSVAGSENDASSLYSSRMSVALSTYSFVDGKVPCKRCTYLNDEGTLLCTVCDLALGANPSLDIDAQIALQIQRRDEEEASMQVVRNMQQESFLGDSSLPAATAPKPTRPIWEQAQNLIADIEAFLGENLLPDAIYRPLPMYDLQFLAAAWINWRETNQRFQPDAVWDRGDKSNAIEFDPKDWSTWIGFHSTTKTEAEVAKDGFCPSPRVVSQPPNRAVQGHDIWLCAVTLGRASKDFQIDEKYGEREYLRLTSSNQCLPLVKIEKTVTGTIDDSTPTPLAELKSTPSPSLAILYLKKVVEIAAKMKTCIFHSSTPPGITLWTTALAILESCNTQRAAKIGDANSSQLLSDSLSNVFAVRYEKARQNRQRPQEPPHVRVRHMKSRPQNITSVPTIDEDEVTVDAQEFKVYITEHVLAFVKHGNITDIVVGGDIKLQAYISETCSVAFLGSSIQQISPNPFYSRFLFAAQDDKVFYVKIPVLKRLLPLFSYQTKAPITTSPLKFNIISIGMPGGGIELRIACTSALEKHLITNLTIQIDYGAAGDMVMRSSMPKNPGTYPENFHPFKSLFRVDKPLAIGESYDIIALFEPRGQVLKTSMFQVCGRFSSDEWRATDVEVSVDAHEGSAERLTTVVHTEIWKHEV